jgi:tetratricopeptide (TPR) repeat protein
MSQPNVPGGVGVQANLQIKGGAAILAPANAFQGGVPSNALILIPLSKPSEELTEKLKTGAVALTPEQMWQSLGFNGPAVTVQDNQGRPITLGLEDLLASLEKHYNEGKDDPNRGRLYAQELMKYGRFEKAEKVLAKVVALGGGGEDWLGLGVAQMAMKDWAKAESTLNGAQNLLPGNPYPALHLSKVQEGQGNKDGARRMIERAITIDPNCVEAWVLLFAHVSETQNADAAIKAVTELADAEPNKKSAAPFLAIQDHFAQKEETRTQAVEWAKKAVDRNPDDSMALIGLSSLYGANGDLQAIISLLSPHEAKMGRDVRLANNYFEALFGAREIDKVTRLLNALAGSGSRDVKQFAIERSRFVAQYLQQQQQKLAGAAAAAPQPSRIIT